MQTSDNVARFGQRSNNPQSVTVEQLLENVLEDIRSGAIRPPDKALVLIFSEANDNGTYDPVRYNARIDTFAEEIGMLEMFKLIALEAWGGRNES